MDNELVLGIEAAVGGGSLCLEKDSEIWTHAADTDRSSAETLLPAMRLLLEESGYEADSLGLIVAAAGPGSFTGIRIGIATAKGLAESLGIPLRQVSLLKAMALASRINEVCVAVPMGRGAVCFQAFRSGSAANRPSVVPTDDLYQLDQGTIAVPTALFREDSATTMIDMGNCLAAHLVRYAKAQSADDRPLFISKTF